MQKSKTVSKKSAQTDQQVMTMLERAELIFVASKDSADHIYLYDALKEHLDFFADWLKIHSVDAFVLINILGLSIKSGGVNFEKLVSYLDWKDFRAFPLKKNLDRLVELSYLENIDSVRYNQYFQLHSELYEAILGNNRSFSLDCQLNSEIEVFEKLNDLLVSLDCNKIEQELYKNRLKNVMDSAQHFLVFKKLRSHLMDWKDLTLICQVIWQHLIGEDSINVRRTLRMYLEQEFNRHHLTKGLLNGTNPLIRLRYLKVIEDEYANGLAVGLHDDYVDHLESNQIDLDIYRMRNRSSKGLIVPESIFKKKLFYNSDEERQIDQLHHILCDQHFANIQKNMVDKGLPKGINILLYGAPGTGKTETVLQLAQESLRVIRKIDISDTKSMWLGQSEKEIKKVFTDYNRMIQNDEKTPILLFNEADGILSRRQDIGSSSVAQTLNAMQNILLEELENFEGIFIATTNLVDNLDPAFERRFLYKVKFNPPSQENKAKIWKTKISFLSETQTQELAFRYSFSGGQIENIARKIQLFEIIESQTPSFEQIQEFCNQESWETSERKKVGF